MNKEEKQNMKDGIIVSTITTIIMFLILWFGRNGVLYVLRYYKLVN